MPRISVLSICHLSSSLSPAQTSRLAVAGPLCNSKGLLVEVSQERFSQVSRAADRKKGKLFLGMLKRRPLKKFAVISKNSRTIPAINAAEEDIAFLPRSVARSGPGMGPRGVGGCEPPVGALQSKSWQVPTLRQMKHQRVRQVS